MTVVTECLTISLPFPVVWITAAYFTVHHWRTRSFQSACIRAKSTMNINAHVPDLRRFHFFEIRTPEYNFWIVKYYFSVLKETANYFKAAVLALFPPAMYQWCSFFMAFRAFFSTTLSPFSHNDRCRVIPLG